METNQDTSLFLMKILEELDSKQNTVSYQDLCKSLCARFDLSQLAKLRSVLFYTACLDPNFPATLFKDKMKCTVNNQQSKKIMVAADIVTIFNLIQMNGGAAKEKLPSGRQKVRKKETSFESCRSDTEVCAAAECEPLNCELSETFHRGYPTRRSSQGRKVDRKDCPQFLPASEPNFLLGVSKELKSRAASLDRLQALAPYSVASPQPCEMQRTYFPMNIENESISDQDSLPIGQGIKETFIANEEPFVVQSCVQKRNIFKEDFHNLMTVSPTLVGPANKAEAERGEPQRQKESHKTPFFNHSFEMPYNSQYLNPVYSPVPDKRRAKHESLDDLQASTYFGPTPVMGPQEARRCPGRPGKQTPWPVKSWSLNTEEVPDFERSFFNRNPSEEKLRYPNSSSQSPNFPTPDRRPTYLAPKDPQQPILPVGYVAKPNGLKSKEMSSPVDLEKHEPVKKFKEKSVSCTSGQLSSDTSSVGTQTEQHVLEPQKCKDLCTSGQSKYGDRHTRKLSDDDSEIISDDISDIFRFLDDMSISGSTGVMQSSCYNSTGSLSQVHKSDGDSSPERHLTKIANGLSSGKGEKGNRPENSHPSEEELKTSVCRLVLRIGEIERKLESLSGVREEISQVLGKLNKLDQKMQQPEKVSVQIDLNSLTSEAPSDDSASPRLFRAHSGPRAPKLENAADWYCSDASGSNSESLRVKALKKSLFPRPSSRSLTEENSATESKIASTSNSPRDWRTITYASRVGLGEEDGKDRGPGESKDWHRKSKEADRQYDIPPQHRLPKQPKDSFLVEQVFSPHPYPASLKAHMKNNPLYTDMRLTELAEVKRGQPSWTIEEYTRNAGDKGKLTALDLQTQESLNPNNLEYWMEDIYTPGYDSLLKRKEAEFRRAKVCKIAALIAAATCTVILVIVVPICTMKS
ncbi:major intrinsically disordered Notch2-binding receptor 1 [Canis lupus baileyi]|uniref:Membrane integral NOTCH2 associated receptor 1 n=3 Tax=Canis lupus TaxID=9612 RepID=A0A8C0RV06_CANLF|nr:major intrinsically disordered Notch2-binding receptor 1 [Canis lupus dingo]XP_038332989.1 major intrinsically disordered Notch2-binding receptor 1 [Canis lupus familiaris]XP_038332994.1 major intrinsically disordered Notch2-binding receptor 1 [Canis lupus familiaris]XP_038388956.1 major intrinsically disordered Notch2-binding receptor 1 [Canis lupus familiaris]XP_038388957.1 major intrinsically disordered Notch2-binding receptor 1 [Canis lupus familiaris]XP_038517465.1 major intrinsically 